MSKKTKICPVTYKEDRFGGITLTCPKCSNVIEITEEKSECVFCGTKFIFSILKEAELSINTTFLDEIKE